MSYLEEASKALGDVKLRAPEKLEVESFKIPGEDTSDVPEEQPTVSRVDSGVFTNEIVKDDELKEIASQHGVKLQQLRDMADLYGATREVGLDEAQGKEVLKNPNFWKSAGLEAAGLLDEMSLNVPSWVYKKMQSEGGEKAFDAVRKLVDERRSLAGTAMRVALPGAGAKAAAAAKGIKAAVGTAAGLGAVGGLANSQSGDEVSSALTGAAMSGAISGAFNPEAINKITTTGTFKKILTKFTRPEVRTKVIAETGGLEQRIKALQELGEVRSELDLFTKLKTKLRNARDASEDGKIEELTTKLAELKDKVGEDSFKKLERYNLISNREMLGNKLLAEKATRESNNLVPPEDLKLGRGTLGITVPADKGGKPFAITKGPDFSTIQHEFAHAQRAEIAASLPVKESVKEISEKLDDKINDIIGKPLVEQIEQGLVAYPEHLRKAEIESWMISLLNNEADRKDFKQYLDLDDKAFNSFLGDIKKAKGRLASWKEKVSADDLVDELKLTRLSETEKETIRKGGGELLKQKGTWPTKSELQNAIFDTQLVDIPRLRFEDKSGFINTYIDGKLFSQSASLEKAKTDALKWKAKNKDKLEILIEKPEPRGTYIPPEK